MPRLRTLLDIVAPNDRPLWGIGWLRASYGYFLVYVGLAVGVITGEPVIAGVAMAGALLVEASDALTIGAHGITMVEWRRGLDIRTYWRVPAFVVALAAQPAPPELIGGFAALALVAALIVRVIRSDRLRLYSETLLRPLGALSAGATRLVRARRAERRRDLAEVWVQGSVLLAAGLIGLATATSLTSEAALAIAAMGTAIAVVNAGIAGLACRRLRPAMLLRHNEEVLAAFRAWDPEVLCYFNGHPGSTYGVDVWLRTFEECGKRVALIYRHRSVESVDTEQLPGLVVTADALVERVVAPSTRIAVYPANGTLNVHLQRDKRLAHVFIGHGDSDKEGSSSPFTQAYDEVWVAGQAAIDRYRTRGVNIPPERFRIVGRPPLSPAARAAERGRLAAQHANRGELPPIGRLEAEMTRHGDDRPVVMYAPTWEGYFDDSDYSSLGSMSEALIDALLERGDVRVVFKPHPLTGHRLPELLDTVADIRRRLRHAPGHHPSTVQHHEVGLYEWFDLAKALVTDVSSLISDFLAWDRPLLVTNPRSIPVDDFLGRYPAAGAAHVVGPEGRWIEELASALDADPLEEQRAALREYYLGPPGSDPLAAFCGALDDLYRATPS